jgi:hypothetical protein
MNIWNRSTRIPEIYGTLIALGLIVYFFLMYAVGLLQVIELRLLNLLIMLAGVYYAMKQYSRTHDGHLNYFRGLTIGVATSAIGASTFSLFLFVFLRFNNDLMQYIIEHEPMGPYLNAYIASFMVLLEGIFSGLFITFVLLNWVRSDQVNEPVGTSS